MGSAVRRVALSLALLARGACSGGGGSPSTAGPLGAAEDALSPAGTTLGDGYTVADGSALIGAPLPAGTTVVQSGTPIVDHGWSAWLYAPGDPSAVVDRYLEQARDHGLTPADLPDGEVYGMEGAPVTPSGWATCGTVTDGDFECSASAADGRGRCLVLRLVRNARVSHMRLQLYLNDRVGFCNGVDGVAVDPGIGPPPVPDEPFAPPQTGGAFGEGWGLLAPVSVEEGSEVVAPPLPGDCGPVALLAVTGDPDDVLDRYIAGLRAQTHVEPHVYEEDVRSGDGTLHRRVVDETAGGVSFRAELLDGDEEGDWLQLSGCRG